MHLTEFSENKPGRIIKTPQGYWAFVPNPLPPELPLSWELARQISEADRNLSELAGVAKRLSNPYLLINPFIRKEAVSSSKIEGTQASLSDLFFFEAARSVSSPTSDVREVANYVKALEHGLARLKELPVSLRLIREIHEHLMEGVSGPHLTPGEFRQSQNWIGLPGCTLMDANFVPPPPAEMSDTLGELEKYFHTLPTLPPLIRMALIHYQFEAIHPFLDGNGRIGRLLITLLLCVEKLLPQPLLYLSAFFEKHRSDYYHLLLAVSQHGQWIEWISFFLRAVTAQSQDALIRSERLLGLREEYRKKFQSVRASALLMSLIDELFSYPATTVARTYRHLKITPRSADLNIQKLVRANILKEVTGQKRNRIFIASEIVRVIESDEING